jgi:hypothetical protein
MRGHQVQSPQAPEKRQTGNFEVPTALNRKLITEYKLNEKWAGTTKAKKLAKQAIRAKLTDFERFKVVTLKRNLGRTLRKWITEKRKTLISKKK